VADLLARDPQFLVKPVSEQAAIVFLDLSGFTGVNRRSIGMMWRCLHAMYLEQPDSDAKAGNPPPESVQLHSGALSPSLSPRA
jgi:hypothetical protein